MQRGAAKRVVAVAAVAALALVALAVLRPSGAGASVQAPTQTTRRGTTRTSAAPSTTPTTDATISTPVPPGQTAPNGGPLLVPGASDSPAGVGNEVKNNDNTGTVVALVITGLLVVALLIGLLTYWFWRNTRPARAPKDMDATPDEAKDAPATVNANNVASANATATKATAPKTAGASKSTTDEPAGAN